MWPRRFYSAPLRRLKIQGNCGTAAGLDINGGRVDREISAEERERLRPPSYAMQLLANASKIVEP